MATLPWDNPSTLQDSGTGEGQFGPCRCPLSARPNQFRERLWSLGPAALTTAELLAILAAATVPELSRNDPYPCGSGKKYKKCHGTGR